MTPASVTRLGRFLFAAVAAFVAGCAARPASVPPRLTPSAAITPNFVVPSVRERMVFSVRAPA